MSAPFGIPQEIPSAHTYALPFDEWADKLWPGDCHYPSPAQLPYRAFVEPNSSLCLDDTSKSPAIPVEGSLDIHDTGGDLTYDKGVDAIFNAPSDSFHPHSSEFYQPPGVPYQWENSLLLDPGIDNSIPSVGISNFPGALGNATPPSALPSDAVRLLDNPRSERSSVPFPGTSSRHMSYAHTHSTNSHSVYSPHVHASPNSLPNNTPIRARSRLKRGTGTPDYTSKNDNGDHLCSTCGKVIPRNRRQDFERHVSSHYPAERRRLFGAVLCCGLPIERYLAEVGQIPPGMEVMTFYGRSMVGGCGREFSRTDSLSRHLKKSVCVGDLKGGWHVRKRDIDIE
ncbi:hypothetical protein BDY19DRAFT_992604 [Irpex rosettiformis]|uniref:Uncharacterized protein n=1 Tax=Irpex rosettiformis TaxID=378272 RepID=A0ACB8U7W4_9APHY|nr:hypothetical protein BDY19DRAFT_992604 [Irpex rosettiformis]